MEPWKEPQSKEKLDFPFVMDNQHRLIQNRFIILSLTFLAKQIERDFS